MESIGHSVRGIAAIQAKRALEDGLIYGYHDDHLTRLQAILLLQKLNKFGLVEGFKRLKVILENQPLSL